MPVCGAVLFQPAAVPDRRHLAILAIVAAVGASLHVL